MKVLSCLQITARLHEIYYLESLESLSFLKGCLGFVKEYLKNSDFFV